MKAKVSLDIILNFFQKGRLPGENEEASSIVFWSFLLALGEMMHSSLSHLFTEVITDANVQILPKDLAEMGKVCVRILIEVKADDLVFDIKREGNRRGPASVAVDEAALALIFWYFKMRRVNRSDGAAKFGWRHVFYYHWIRPVF